MRYPPIVHGYPKLLHGGDYNPDQWLDRPEIIDEDFRLAGLAGVNSFSVAIFAWAALEPEEGKFEFGWLDKIMDRMAAADMKAVLATPSGAKPNWMARKYPEIRRVTADGRRELQAGRHNHCFTSPVYREKVATINEKMAERYRRHPALGVWHLSNEYSGECHCDLCLGAFREWLKRKYGTLDKLNKAWWTAFWAHRYTGWDQIEAVDGSVHGLKLDWMRFVSDQTTDFLRAESEPLRRLTPDVPRTTNLMGTFFQLDYRRLAKELDVVSWDNYPAYHDRDNTTLTAGLVSFTHDLTRCLKGGKPFLLMESSPSAVNWMKVNKLLRPGIHRLKSLQAVAHGADSVQYFQWRKSRGSAEKLHGAVVDHVGHENTRVFRDVADLGKTLTHLAGVTGCATPAETAVIFDWENRWILSEAQGPLKDTGDGSAFWHPPEKFHGDWALAQYRAFWRQGIPVDVIGMDDDFSRYKLLVAPSLYMLKPGVAERLEAFVKAGGTLVGTFLTGIADENDLVFDNGWPGPLRPLFGVWAEEIDYLYPDEKNRLCPVTDEDGANPAGLSGDYGVTQACDLIHAESAEVLATYGDDFYAARPCLTVKTHGEGDAFYLAARTDDRFLDDFYRYLTVELDIARALDADLPAGVTAQVRTDGAVDYVFLMNFTRVPRDVSVSEDGLEDAETGEALAGAVPLAAYGSRVLRRPHRVS